MNQKFLLLSKLASLVVAVLGMIVMAADKLSVLPTGLVSPDTFAGKVVAWVICLGGCAHLILNQIHTNQLQNITNALPASTQSSGVSKTGLFLIGFLLLASMGSAQSLTPTPVPSVILRYQNFSLNKEVITGSIQGDFLTPMIVGGYTPLEIQNNQITLGSNQSIDLAYAFTHANLSADGAGGINEAPYWYAGFFVGGGIFGQANNIYLAQGTVGLFIGKPDLLGPFALAVQDNLGNGSVSAGVVLVGVLDILGGSGIVQVH